VYGSVTVNVNVMIEMGVGVMGADVVGAGVVHCFTQAS